MKVIFLDIDGVLNSEDYAQFCIENYGRTKCTGEFIDPRACARVVEFLDSNPDTKLVISSTRRCMTTDETKEKFKSIEGLDTLVPYIISVTPTLMFSKQKLTDRGEDIEAWFYEWAEEHPSEIIENYVIVDDNTDFFDSQKEHLVLTDDWFGLTLQNVKEIDEILNGSGKEN